MLSEINNRIRHIKKVVTTTSLDNSSAILTQLSDIDDQLYGIRKELYGDQVASRLDKGNPMSVSGRLGWMTYEMWNTTSTPTNTQKNALKLAKEGFAPILTSIKGVDASIQKIEAQFKNLENF